MSDLIDLYNSFAESPIQDLNIIFNAFSEHQAFRQAAGRLQNVSSHITETISKSTTRYEGLLHLESFLQQCPHDVLIEKATIWLSMTTKACQSEDISCKIQGFKTLDKLLLSVSVSPESKKLVSSGNLGKIFECVLLTSNAIQYHALNCLETCLRNFPGASGSQKNVKDLENHLLSFADSRDVPNVKPAAKCLHLLQQVKGGGIKAHKALWTQQFISCFGSLHDCLDNLFDNLLEVENSAEVGMSTLPLDILEFTDTDTEVSRYVKYFRRFNNICHFVQAMLSEPFPVAKGFPADFDSILQLITRGLAMSGNVLGDKKTSSVIVKLAFLPLIQTQVLQVLDSLIRCLRLNLLMYGEQICKAVFRVLQWTSTRENKDHIKSYRNLRRIAYLVLTGWLRLSTSGSSVELVVDNLLTEIINDITPFKDYVTLSIQTGANKHMSKAERQKLKHTKHINGNFQTPNIKNESPDGGNETLCVAALQCLQAVLVATDPWLKPDKYEELLLKVVLLLFDVQRAATKEGLYADATTRLELYGVLFALVQNPVPSIEPPTCICIHLFTIGKNDTNLKVAQACSNWLSILVNANKSRPQTLQAEIIRNANKSQLMKKLLNDPSQYVFFEGHIISTQRSETNNTVDISKNEHIEDRGNPELLEKMKVILNSEKDYREDANLKTIANQAKEIIRKNLKESDHHTVNSEVAQDEKQVVEVGHANDSENNEKETAVDDVVVTENISQETVVDDVVVTENVSQETAVDDVAVTEIVSQETAVDDVAATEIVSQETAVDDVVITENVSEETVVDDVVVTENVSQENEIAICSDSTKVSHSQKRDADEVDGDNISVLKPAPKKLKKELDVSAEVEAMELEHSLEDCNISIISHIEGKTVKTIKTMELIEMDAAEETAQPIIVLSDDDDNAVTAEDGNLTADEMLKSFVADIDDDTTV